MRKILGISAFTIILALSVSCPAPQLTPAESPMIEIGSSEAVSSFNVGDEVSIDGVSAVIAYKAEVEEEWGQYILAEEYDLNHYEPEVGNNEPGRIYKGKPWDSRVKASEGRGEIIGLDSEIGTGLQNTDKLIGKFSTDENLWYYVASHREVTSPAWFVPSVDELYQLKLQRKEIGNFTENHYETGIYWSSTEQISYPTSEGTSYAAYAHKFYDDAENFLGEYKSSARRIRLCRYSTEEELSKQTFLVTLSAENEEAVIHYTIDGSEPNSSSLVYEKPFRVPVGTTVKAISTLAGFANSEVAEGYAK